MSSSIPPRIAAVLRSAATLRTARELFAAQPSGDVLVIVGPGVEVPEQLGATAPAGDARVALAPLAIALDVARARSVAAGDDLAAPPPSGAVRVLYLDAARGSAVCSMPGAAVGRVEVFDVPRGAA